MKPLCLVVILMLLALKAEGQIDSSIKLNLLVVGDTYPWKFTTTANETFSGILPVYFSTNTTEPNIDTFVHQFLSPGFGCIIDTTQLLLRNLEVAQNLPTGTPPVGRSSFSAAQFELDFDSIPLVRSNNSFRTAPGRYHAYLQAWVNFSAAHAGGGPDMGGWNWSGDVYDSVLFRIDKNLASVDRSVLTTSKTSIYYQPNSRSLRFEPESFNQYLDITDLVGRKIERMVVPAGSMIEYISLPSGCYFARLGTEVAKFVVTE